MPKKEKQNGQKTGQKTGQIMDKIGQNQDKVDAKQAEQKAATKYLHKKLYGALDITFIGIFGSV